MCKFNNNLFAFTIFLAILHGVCGRPIKRFFDYYDDSDDYDLHFDQRQNGTDNYRIHFDGFLIAFPSEGAISASNVLGAFGGDLLDNIPLHLSSGSYDDSPYSTEKLDDDGITGSTEVNYLAVKDSNTEENLSEKSNEAPLSSKKNKSIGRQRTRLRLFNLLNLLKGNYKHA